MFSVKNIKNYISTKILHQFTNPFLFLINFKKNLNDNNTKTLYSINQFEFLIMVA